ncbi:S-layer protein [uncultured archaeon]|nr:S-layer protein [uncultured archaeon]
MNIKQILFTMYHCKKRAQKITIGIMIMALLLFVGGIGAASETTDSFEVGSLNYITPVTPSPTEISTSGFTLVGDKKTLYIGESWDVGYGFRIEADSIDAKSTPKALWLVLYRNGKKLDDKVIYIGETYNYNNIFRVNVSDIRPGDISDKVTLSDAYIALEYISAPESTPTTLAERELGYDDGIRNREGSLGPKGHAVLFSTETPIKISGIKIYGSRYDDFSRQFDIEIWDSNFKKLYSATYDYKNQFPDSGVSIKGRDLKDSGFKWVKFDMPNIEVNGNFYVTLFTYSGPPSWENIPEAPKGGIYVGVDSDTKSGHSFVVDKNPNRITDWPTEWNLRQESTDWMIRVVCTSDSPCTESKTVASASNPINPLAGGSEPTPVAEEAIATKQLSEKERDDLLKDYSKMYSYYADISENAENDAPFKILKDFETDANDLSNELKPKIKDMPKDVVSDIVNPYTDFDDFINLILAFQRSMRFLQQADFIFQLADDTENNKILQDIAPKLKELSQTSGENPDNIAKQRQLITDIKSDLDKINSEKYIKKGIDAKPVIIEDRPISEGESFQIELEMPSDARQINYKIVQKENYKALELIGSDPSYKVTILNNPDNLWWTQSIKSMSNWKQDFWNGYTDAISWTGSTEAQPEKILLKITCTDTGGDFLWIKGNEKATITLKFVYLPEKSYSWGLGDFLKNYTESLNSGLEKHERLLKSSP